MGVASCSGTYKYKSSDVHNYSRKEGYLHQLFETEHAQSFNDKNKSVLWQPNFLGESETTSRSSSSSDFKNSTADHLKKSRRTSTYGPSTLRQIISCFQGNKCKSHCKPEISPYIPRLDAIWLAAQEVQKTSENLTRDFPKNCFVLSLGDDDSTCESVKVISEDDMKWECLHHRDNSRSSTFLLPIASESVFQRKIDSLLLNLMLYEIDSTDSFESN